MNRSIKFKRYHFDSEKKLISVTQWGKIIKSFRIYEDSELSFTSPSSVGNTETFIDCQFVNLKDKNGVEIYEGDVSSFTYQKKEHKGVVTLDKYYNFILKTNEKFFNIYYLESVQIGIIIGNIYENPELIN